MSSQIWRTRPYAHALEHVVDQMSQQSFAPFTGGNAYDGGSTGFQSLPVNVWESEDSYLATFMAPGLDEQNINVTVHDDTLAIDGALAFQALPEGATVVWQEFYASPGQVRFRRSLRLGAAVDSSKVEAGYRNGLLTITIPKAENAKPRQVQVQLTSNGTK